MSYKITIELEAKEGDRVLVENYRSKYKPWEEGTVTDVDVSVYEDLRCFVGYDVVLDRKGPITRRGRPSILVLHLCADQVRRI